MPCAMFVPKHLKMYVTGKLLKMVEPTYRQRHEIKEQQRLGRNLGVIKWLPHYQP